MLPGKKEVLAGADAGRIRHQIVPQPLLLGHKGSHWSLVTSSVDGQIPFRTTVQKPWKGGSPANPTNRDFPWFQSGVGSCPSTLSTICA